MKKTLAFLFIMALFFTSYTSGSSEIKRKEKMTEPIAQIFEVNLDNLHPKIILEMKENGDESISGEAISEERSLNHRKFPIALEKKSLIWQYFLEDDRIFKKQITLSSSYDNPVLDFAWRGLVILPLLLAIFRFKRSKDLFLISIAIIVGNALIGAFNVMMVNSFRSLLLLGPFLGLCLGAILGLAGGSIGGSFSKIIGLICGSITGAMTAVYVTAFGWNNAGMNDYLVFLVLVCALSLLVKYYFQKTITDIITLSLLIIYYCRETIDNIKHQERTNV